MGGVFVLKGLVNNKLNFGDNVQITNSESTDDEGGIAIFYGDNDYLTMSR